MIRLKFLFVLLVFGTGCSSVVTNTEFYDPILYYLKSGQYEIAVGQIEYADSTGQYSEKDRVLMHLDKGIIYHYNGQYLKSNVELEEAERAIEELFTKSISKGAASMLLNDNALDYDGEVYEDLYINIFKALNYLHLNKFDDAYVEVKRITNKLSELDVKYEEYVAELNESDDSKINIKAEDLDYYNNVLVNYISYLIFRAEGEGDNSRISLKQLKDAWTTYSDVYEGELPASVTETTTNSGSYLNVIAFAGTGPVKEPVGARITTFNDFVLVSDPTNFYVDAIPFPGIKYGWNFKFEFPQLVEPGTSVYDIEIYIDSSYAGKLELLENMSNVARKTFETEKSIIFFKTITRAILKGIGSSALGREVKKEAKGALGDILAGVINAAVDATEHADLRGWRTMPGYAFVGEVPIDKGEYDIEIRFVADDGTVLKSTYYNSYEVSGKINLIETFYLD